MIQGDAEFINLTASEKKLFLPSGSSPDAVEPQTWWKEVYKQDPLNIEGHLHTASVVNNTDEAANNPLGSLQHLLQALFIHSKAITVPIGIERNKDALHHTHIKRDRDYFLHQDNRVCFFFYNQ